MRRWMPLRVGRSWNPKARALATNASGVYAFRDGRSGRVLYVGESSTGALWKTLTRHLYDWRSLPEHFYDRDGNVRRGRETFTLASLKAEGVEIADLEVAIEVTSTGKRARSAADQGATDAQARWIAELMPALNEDDGRRSDDAATPPAEAEPFALEQEPEEDFFGSFNPRRRNPPKRGASAAVSLAPNVEPERRAENRTPDLFTGKTKLEEMTGKARTDWKGRAERLAGELAECQRGRSAPPPGPVEEPPPPPPPEPPPRPEGYGATNERGQARMFNPRRSNPGEPPARSGWWPGIVHYGPQPWPKPVACGARRARSAVATLDEFEELAAESKCQKCIPIVERFRAQRERKRTPNPPPPSLDDPAARAEFLLRAGAYYDRIEVHDTTSRTCDVRAEGRIVLSDVRDREWAEWLVDAWKTARTDAVAHHKVSAMIPPPPRISPREHMRVTGFNANGLGPSSLGLELADEEGTLHREVLGYADSAWRARFFAQLGELGLKTRADFDAHHKAKAETQLARPTHQLRQGMRVRGQADRQGGPVLVGEVMALHPNDELSVRFVAKEGRGGKLVEFPPIVKRVHASQMMAAPAPAAPPARARKPKAPTFAEKRAALLDDLAALGWKVARDLKTPHATNDDGDRLWFRSQAILLGHASGGERGARSLVSDMREVQSGATLAAMVAGTPAAPVATPRVVAAPPSRRYVVKHPKTGEVLAGETIAGVMARADREWPYSGDLAVHTDRTSDGTLWGEGRGAVVATRSQGKWLTSYDDPSRSAAAPWEEAREAKQRAADEAEDRAFERVSDLLREIDPRAELAFTPGMMSAGYGHAIARDGSPIATVHMQRKGSTRKELLEALAAELERVKAERSRPRKVVPKSYGEVYAAIDGGPAHALAVDAAPWAEDNPLVRGMLNDGLIAIRPASARFPRRYVVTNAGLHERGTFEVAPRTFIGDAHDAGAQARRKKGADLAALGYGTEETGKKKAGQLRMFNPRRRNPAARASAPKPTGDLVELGKLTELEYEEPGTRRIAVLRWALETAPILATDKRARLFVVYGGTAPRSASAAARKKYAREHWGKQAKGVELDASALVGDAEVLGTSTRITYTTRKGTDSKAVDYVHAWGEGKRGPFRAPVVVCQRGPGGKVAQVALSGGTYRVTTRGIVG